MRSIFILGPEILICEIFFDEDGINFDENVFATTFIPGNCTAHSHEKNILFLTFNLSGDICAFQILTHLDEAFNFKLKTYDSTIKKPFTDIL